MNTYVKVERTRRFHRPQKKQRKLSEVMTSLGGFVKIVDHSNMCADVLFESFCMCGPLWCWRVLVCRYACSRFVWNEHEEELRCFAADILLLLLDSFSSSFGPICLFPVLQRLLRVLRLLLLKRCVHVGKAAWMPDSCILMQTIDRFSKLVFFKLEFWIFEK